MNLRQPRFTTSACGELKKKKKKNHKDLKKKQEIHDKYIYQNELDKVCFQHDRTYGDFKDLIRRTASDKTLRVKAFKSNKNPKYDGFQKFVLQWSIN